MSKPLFPAQKRVTFKDPLDEEVKTSKYILAHWDLVEVSKKEEQERQEDLAKESNVPKIESNNAPSVVVEMIEEQVIQPITEELTSPTRARLAEFKFPTPSTDATLIPIVNNLSPIIFSSPQTISSSSSPITSPIHTPVLSTIGSSPTNQTLPPLSHSLPDRSIQRHLKRDSSSSNSPSSPTSEGNDSDDSCAHTPVAGRSKKRRMWAWTLGPLEGYSEGSLDEDVETSESIPAFENKSIENMVVVEGDFVMIEKTEE